MNIDLLKRLSEAPGVPGREERVREIVSEEAKGLFDTVSVDPMGSLIATRKPRAHGGDAANKPKRILIACHIDEIGFLVRHVDERGFLRLHNVGGFDTRTLLARRVRVQASSGNELPGLLNVMGRPIHISRDEERKKIPEITDLIVDLCLPGDVVREQVRIGDPVTFVQEFSEIGQCVTGKAMDNRVAAFVALEALRKAPDTAHEVILAATVQEEIGCRGAGVAAYSAEPDVAIAIDTTLCVDIPGVPEDERVTQQGAGVALTVADSNTLSDRSLIAEFEAAAKSAKIPFQLSILPRGGTDAGPMQRSRGGHRAMTLSVPTRYVHTTTECIHKHDLQSAIDLLAAWLMQ